MINNLVGQTMRYGYYPLTGGRKEGDELHQKLLAQGCSSVTVDPVSDLSSRPGWVLLMSSLKAGDEIMVQDLADLGLSLPGIVQNLYELGSRPVVIFVGEERLNPGHLEAYPLLASLSRHIKKHHQNRTKEGLKKAAGQGRKGGRPRGLAPESRLKAIAAEALYKEDRLSVNEIAQYLEISKATLYDYLRRRSVPVGTLKKKKVHKEPMAEAAGGA